LPTVISATRIGFAAYKHVYKLLIRLWSMDSTHVNVNVNVSMSMSVSTTTTTSSYLPSFASK